MGVLSNTLTIIILEFNSAKWKEKLLGWSLPHSKLILRSIKNALKGTNGTKWTRPSRQLGCLSIYVVTPLTYIPRWMSF